MEKGRKVYNRQWVLGTKAREGSNGSKKGVHPLALVLPSPIER